MIDASARSGHSTSGLGLAFLALASGSSDVIAFLTLGTVFTSAMTGNTALLGIAISKGTILAASQPAAALFGFVVGVAVATIVLDPGHAAARPAQALRNLLLVEVACLGSFALVWQIDGHPAEGAAGYALILLSATGMGIQGVAARHINVAAVSTIVFTSTLLTIVASATAILLRRSDGPDSWRPTRRQVAIFLAYLTGAALAGLMIRQTIPLLPWLPATAAVLALLCYEFAQGRSPDEAKA